MIALRTRGGAWVIDVRKFAGAPRLWLDDQKDHISIRLSGAIFPGTRLPADCECTLSDGPTGWRLSLQFPFAEAVQPVPLVDWVEGLCTIQSRTSPCGVVFQNDDHSSVSLVGNSKVAFSANWTLKFHGSRAVRVRSIHGAFTADSVEIALADGGAPSLLAVESERRSSIRVPREHHTWCFQMPASEPDGSRLEFTENAFESVEIESVESPAGIFSSITANSGGGTAAHHFPTPEVESEFHLPLERLTYTVANGPAGRETAIVGRFSAGPVTLSGHGLDIRLAGFSATPLFESHCSAPGSYRKVCEPSIGGVTLAFDGALARLSRK